MAEHYDTEGHVRTEKKTRVTKPRMFRVILHNDDYTTMDFVVSVLKDVFHRSDAEAVHIMLKVHHTGYGVAGVYTRELAETRIDRVHELARQNQHPLRCSMEPER